MRGCRMVDIASPRSIKGFFLSLTLSAIMWGVICAPLLLHLG